MFRNRYVTMMLPIFWQRTTTSYLEKRGKAEYAILALENSKNKIFVNILFF